MIRDFTIFPALETERLLLRKLCIDDVNEIFMLRSDKEHNKYIDRPLAASIEDAKSFINKIEGLVNDHKSFFWVVVLKGQNELSGTITLWNLDEENNKAELGYELLPSYYTKGIMTEALAAVLNFGFANLKLSKIEAWLHPGNNRSEALLQRFNFKRDHEAEEHKPADAAEIIYSLSAGNH